MTAPSLLQDRSFSCTFCHRKFTSAQALGGHMNLHRRERARLRTSFPPSLFSDPLSSCQFWAFDSHLFCNKSNIFDPSSITFLHHHQHGGGKVDASCNDDDDDGGHDLKPKRLAKMRRQSESPENSIMGGVDLELRLGQSMI